MYNFLLKKLILMHRQTGPVQLRFLPRDPSPRHHLRKVDNDKAMSSQPDIHLHFSNSTLNNVQGHQFNVTTNPGYLLLSRLLEAS